MNNTDPLSILLNITPDIVDESEVASTPGITYLGFWSPGPTPIGGDGRGQARWQIRRITVTAATGETITEYANGNDAFDKIWNNRKDGTYLYRLRN
ncbi:MAG: hypothetical protein PHX80_05450 [Candidatus Nanoarchaeia archaeon]|nr:hypothetical protein [Candidatus Nanoarchaeia archaeon]